MTGRKTARFSKASWPVTEESFKFEVDDQVREIAIAEVFSLTLHEGNKPVYLASET